MLKPWVLSISEKNKSETILDLPTVSSMEGGGGKCGYGGTVRFNWDFLAVTRKRF